MMKMGMKEERKAWKQRRRRKLKRILKLKSKS